MSGFLSGRTVLSSVDTAQITADAVTSAKIADDQIDSEHYVNGSIDTAHIAANQIDGTLTKDALIADYSDVTITASDLIMYGDATDSNNTKRDTVQGILDLAGGGGLRFISKTQIAHDNSAAVEITGLTGYTAYKIFLVNVSNDSTSGTFDCQIANSGTTWITSSYKYTILRGHTGTATFEGGVNTNSGSSIQLAASGIETGDYPISADLTLFRGIYEDGNRTDNASKLIGQLFYHHNATGNVYAHHVFGTLPTTTSAGCVAIKFYKNGGGNLQHGHIAVFGIAES